MKFSTCAAACFCFCLAASPTSAMDLKIVTTDGKQIATFSQDEIEAMNTSELKTNTPWTEGVTTFTGIDGETLLKSAGLEDVSIIAIALDDYAISLDWEDFTDHNALIATRMNGKRMTPGNKGPFWIVFDYDGLKSETDAGLESKSVWHLVELEVE